MRSMQRMGCYKVKDRDVTGVRLAEKFALVP
jgi:hypothetical protein